MDFKKLRERKEWLESLKKGDEFIQDGESYKAKSFFGVDGVEYDTYKEVEGWHLDSVRVCIKNEYGGYHGEQNIQPK